MAPPHDLHLRGRGLDAVAAPLQHRLEQVPAGVRHQLEQRLVDRGQRDFAVGRRLAVRQRDLHRHPGLAAHRVAGAVGGDLDVEPVRLVANADLGESQPERRPG